MSRSLKKLTSSFCSIFSYNMKTSLICCMNGNRTIEVLVSQCKTVFFLLSVCASVQLLSGKLHRLSSFSAPTGRRYIACCFARFPFWLSISLANKSYGKLNSHASDLIGIQLQQGKIVFLPSTSKWISQLNFMIF